MVHVDWKTVKKIVLLNFITITVGDSMYLLPMLQRLKKAAPQAEMILTGSATTKTVLGAEPALDTFVELPELEQIGKNLSRWEKAKAFWSLFWKAVKMLREEKPDVAVMGIPNYPLYQLIPFFARVPVRVGFSYPGNWLKWTLSDSVVFQHPDTTGEVNVHISKITMNVMHALNLEFTDTDLVIRRTVTDAELKAADAVLHETKKKGPFIAFQVGAKYKNRQWPPERFAEVGRELITGGATIILLGSPGEHPICEQVKQGIGDNCVNLAGKVPFGTIAAIFARCKMVVGNDSGLMHLAASVGTQTVGLFGSPNPNHTRPLGVKKAIIVIPPNWNEKALFEHEPTNVVSPYLLGISAKLVIRACKDGLAGKQKDAWYQEKA